MKVIATGRGHVGHPITVERTRKTRRGVLVEQTPADYILPGDVFAWEGELGKWMEPVEKEAGPTKKEIMAQLDAAGIPYFKGASIEKLHALLPKE